MTQLVSYAEATAVRLGEPRRPSHRCDDCGKDLYVRPIPWQLAWPRPGGGDRCSDCHEAAVRRRACVERERELRRLFDELRMQAPNARDFPNWAAFEDVQRAHESALSALEAELEIVVQEAHACA